MTSDSSLKKDTLSSTERLGFFTKLAYGAGDLGPAITANVLVFFLLFFFTQVAGLPPGLAGSILLIGKISDAVNDPIVGALSDRTRTRWGRRLPWMILGAIPFGLLFFLQWIVPRFSENETANDWWLFGYYALIGILFNLAYTVVNLPYTALTPELTQDYNERTSLNSFRFAFSLGGSILSLLLAGVVFAAFPEDSGRQYTVFGGIVAGLAAIPLFWCALGLQERGTEPILDRSLKQKVGLVLVLLSIGLLLFGIVRFVSVGSQLMLVVSVLFGLLLLSFGLTLCLRKPEASLSDRAAVEQRQRAQTSPQIPFREQLKIAFSNRPFLFVIGLYLCSWLAVQLTASILPYFVVSWMGLPESAFPNFALAVQGTALVMLFVWSAFNKKLEKKTVYSLGLLFWLLAQGGLFFVQPGQVVWLFILAIIAGCGVSVAYLIPWSMVADVIELDELRTGQRREGIFYGFMVLLQKVGLALGLFLVGQALDLAGFIESAAGEPIPNQPESALLAIRIAIGPLPAIALLGGLILAYFYPLTREVHDEARLRLAERREAE